MPSTVLEAIGSGCARLRDLSLMCWGEPLYGFTRRHPWFDFEDVGAVLGDSFPGLTRLEVVMDGKVGDADAQASALASRLAGTLRDLSIHGWVHPVGDAGARDIARFLGGGLERLSFTGSRLGHEGLLAIATRCRGLRALDIGSGFTAPDEESLRSILPHPAGLLELNACNLVGVCGAADVRAEAMRAVSLCAALERLDISSNGLGDETVIHIVSSCAGLRELRVLHNDLTDAVVPALMRLTRLSHLALVGRQRDVGRLLPNRVSGEGVERLRSLPDLLVLH